MATTAEKQIIFTGPNVTAIREDRKTQTRRLIGAPSHWSIPPARLDDGYLNRFGTAHPDSIKCPYFVGQTLWVRETWQLVREVGQEVPSIEHPPETTTWWEPYEGKIPIEDGLPKGWLIAYRATDGDDYKLDELPWRSPYHMPKWACRERLKVTEVRAQNLQDISEEDARAEGFTTETMPARINGKLGEATFFDPIRWYVAVWDAINPKTPWLDNPLVWAITFERIRFEQIREA